MRCKMPCFKNDKKYEIFMCGMCATRMGPLSIMNPNKNSCYICGGFVFAHQAKNATVCAKHYNFMLNNGNDTVSCCLCKMMLNKNGAIKPVNASICNFCTIADFCCRIVTD